MPESKNITVSKKVLIVRNCDNYFKYLTCSMMRNRREGDVKAGTHANHRRQNIPGTQEKHLRKTQNIGYSRNEQGKRLTWCGTHETVLEQEMGTDSRP